MQSLRWPSALTRNNSQPSTSNKGLPSAPNTEESRRNNKEHPTRQFSMDEKLPFANTNGKSKRSSLSVGYKTPDIEQSGTFQTANRPRHPFVNNYPDLASPASQISNMSSVRGLAASATGPNGELNTNSMLLELLSSQAMIEAKEFEVMNWTQLETLKKQHAKSVNRISAMTHKLNLETKMRDANASLSQPGTPASSTFTPEDEARIQMVNKELDNLKARENELRTKLLKHMAGVLSLVLSRREEEEAMIHAGLASPSLVSSNDGRRAFSNASKANGRKARNPRSSTTPSPDSASGSSTSAGQNKSANAALLFEGPHLFATAADLSIPFSNSFSDFPPDNGPATRGIDPTVHAELEKTLDQSDRALLSMRQQFDDLQAEHRSLLERFQAQEIDSQASLRSSQARAEQAERKAAALEQGVIQGAQASQRDVDLFRQRAEEAVNAHHADREAWSRAEATHREQIGLANAHLENYSRSLVEIASRHDPSSLDGLPPEDDHEGLAFHLTQALDRSFGQTQNQLETLQRDTDAANASRSNDNKMVSELRERLRAAQQEVQSSSGQLRSALQEQETLKADLEARRLSSAASSRRHQDLEDDVREKAKALENLKAAEDSAARATSSLQALQSEHAALQASLASVNQKFEDLSAKDAKTTKILADLHRQLPSIDAKTKLGSGSDSSIFKKVFSLPPSSETPPLLPFRLDTFADKVRALVDSNQKLLDRLAKEEEQQQRANAKTIQDHASTQNQLQIVTADLAKSQKELQTAQKEVKQLEEQMNVSANQQASMLERLNELQDSAEKFRLEKRQLEQSSAGTTARIQTLEASCASLENQLKTAQANSALQSELDDLKDQLQDAEEELQTNRTRENKKRAELTAEIEELQQQTATLRAQLRQEQRRKKSP